MKAAGIPDTNPDLIKARNLLAMVQKRNQYLQQQQQQQMMKQQHQRQQSQSEQQNIQQNGAAAAMNGAKLADGLSAPSTSGPSAGAQSAVAPAQVPSADGQTPTSATSGGQGGFTKEQLFMLRNQISAF